MKLVALLLLSSSTTIACGAVDPRTLEEHPTAEAENAVAATPEPGCETAKNGFRFVICEREPGDLGIAECSADDHPGPCLDYSACDPRDPTIQYCTMGGDPAPDSCDVTDAGYVPMRRECGTPLVLAFDRQPVSFTHPAGDFDLAGAGASFETDWISAATPWLALDRDGNGRIDDGTELFGSMTRLPDGRRAAHGFEALGALDDDHDGALTAHDAAFSRLLVWSDQNQDRSSQPHELESATARGLVAIHLDYRNDRRCTGSACEIERARFEWRGGAGDVVDVHFGSTR